MQFNWGAFFMPLRDYKRVFHSLALENAEKLVIDINSPLCQPIDSGKSIRFCDQISSVT